jgi:hypothetical protein
MVRAARASLLLRFALSYGSNSCEEMEITFEKWYNAFGVVHGVVFSVEFRTCSSVVSGKFLK